MKRFQQTQGWLNIASAMLATASDVLFKTYDTREFCDHPKVDLRIEQLRKCIWELREELLNVRDGLEVEEPIEACNEQTLEERYRMGLMSPEEEMAYIFPKPEKVNELPF